MCGIMKGWVGGKIDEWAMNGQMGSWMNKCIGDWVDG